jgi:hypothetical protein
VEKEAVQLHKLEQEQEKKQEQEQEQVQEQVQLQVPPQVQEQVQPQVQPAPRIQVAVKVPPWWKRPSADALKRAYEEGVPILIWRMGAFKSGDIWKAVIDPQRQTNLLTVIGTDKLPTVPMKYSTGPGSAVATLQWLGKGPRHRGAADLGIVDVFWGPKGGELRFGGGGLKTNVGTRMTTPTKGIEIGVEGDGMEQMETVQATQRLGMPERAFTEGEIATQADTTVEAAEMEEAAKGLELEEEEEPILEPKAPATRVDLSKTKTKPKRKAISEWDRVTTLKGFNAYTSESSY